MAKIIKYQFMKESTRKIPTRVPRLDDSGNPMLDPNGKPMMTTEMREETKQTFTNCALYCPTEESYENNLLLAQREAYNGEYTVEDDGVEVNETPTQLDIIEAQVAYTAMMTDTLLEV